MAQPNIDSVPLIGRTFTDNGIDPHKMRWKLYQVSPIGPRKVDIVNGDLLITNEQFEAAVRATRLINPLFKVESQPYINSFGRYFHVFPDGESHIVSQGKDGLPCEIEMGNVVKDFNIVLSKLNEIFDFNHNSKHGGN